ncbi:MAG: hypothetical protein F6K00_16625 [Leptolyngbya sp. SIOISBB]|nr:hypothetical protein [Leptolyngbya sp. SIOISBB]
MLAGFSGITRYNKDGDSVRASNHAARSDRRFSQNPTLMVANPMAQAAMGHGGAIFLKSGRRILDQTAFINNAAIAGSGAHPGEGKGGAIVNLAGLHDEAAESHVITLDRPPSWQQNRAADASDRPDDNANMFGPLWVFPTEISAGAGVDGR